ncbi:MAG TPA: cob(I)yrinic acid a,c-diamide adenosyltransferase [Gammaproteobacteria bacterium]|nr:cob(I)yrinic acid a,c-diamide adenosyltransferase [Gammaproteobacteria bacterium]
MVNRLTKIYTRTGDDGTTGTVDGRRVAKDTALIEAFGTLDELNSYLGLLLASGLPEDAAEVLRRVQHWLFNIGAEAAGSRNYRLPAGAVTELEAALDRYNAGLPPLKEFILPGGSHNAALCHVARTVCRRAERRLLSWLTGNPDANPELLKYLNRLSDLLFVLARVLLRAEGGGEVYWSNPLKDKDGQ